MDFVHFAKKKNCGDLDSHLALLAMRELIFLQEKNFGVLGDLNPRSPDLKSDALPTALSWHGKRHKIASVYKLLMILSEKIFWPLISQKAVDKIFGPMTTFGPYGVSDSKKVEFFFVKHFGVLILGYTLHSGRRPVIIKIFDFDFFAQNPSTGVEIYGNGH